MAELVLGAVGVVPIVGFVLQSYKVVSKVLRDFRHCSAVVKRTQFALTYQQRIFENECQLLLQLAGRDSFTIDDMLDDPEHPEWAGADLDQDIAARLGNNQEAYLCSLEACSEALKELREQFKEFDAVYGQRMTGERLKDTVRRLRKVQTGFKIAVNETKYRSVVADLKESTEGLIALRRQIMDLETQRAVVRRQSNRPPSPSNGSECGSIEKTRQASQALHKALSEAWNCGQAIHQSHLLNLFTESKLVGEEIQLDLAIAWQDCQPEDMDHRALVALVVRSQTLNACPRLAPTTRLVDEDQMSPKREAKRLRTAHVTGTSFSGTVGSAWLLPRDPICRLSCDLRASKDFCSELTQRAQPPSQKAVEVCIGHLDVSMESGYRHSFFPGRSKLACRDRPIALWEVLDSPMNESVSTVDRLKLARALILTVLKFHATPWLRDRWSLQDLAIFSGHDHLAKALDTLHFGVNFVQKHGRQESGPMDGVRGTANDKTDQSEYHQLLYGIDNFALYSLGVALLQIDRWQKLEVETPDDIFQVRRLSRGRFSLGPQYGEITKKCLRCDFGQGDDLMKQKLQQAVYSDAVSVVETMIRGLDLNEEDEEYL